MANINNWKHFHGRPKRWCKNRVMVMDGQKDGVRIELWSWTAKKDGF